jgi:hypothetical protein
MAFWNNWFGGDDTLTEATKAFKNKGKSGISDKQIETISGEGVDDALFLSIYGRESAGNFNSFYNDFINTTFTTKRIKIQNYRFMSEMPEISSVLEDIAIESTQEDENGKILQMEILDPDINENENIVHNLEEEFDELFHRKMRINTNIIDYVRTYYIDSELYLEKVVQKGKASNGIVNVKKLPTETMDYFLNPKTGRIEWYYQALSADVKPPKTFEEAEKEEKIIVFLPEQISHIDYGVYQGSKKSVQGYLEKSKQPFNQLKLLETSVVIYRIVKAPERLVFTIDTGAMPRDKSLKFVDKIKKNLTQKVEFNSKTGQLKNQTDVMSMMDNYFLPQSSDGRGSSVESIGGNPSGFAELDDIYYFARKLYISLKYPISRVIQAEERRQGETLFMGGNSSEITIDEIRWAKFLERHQQKFCQIWTDMFLLHLEFKGLKAEYEIDINKINVTMTPPNDYKQQMAQMLLETQMNNYTNLSNNPEFSKSFLMKKFLKWDDDMIKENADGFAVDKKLLPEDDFG